MAYNGGLAVGARVEFFDAGTNTPRTMYTSGLLTTEFDPLDIRTDANGCFPDIFGQGSAYKAVVYAPGGSVLYTTDNIPGDVTSGGGGGGGGSTTQETGDIQPSILSGSRSGWVRANARTIGSAASGATELADATAEDLFVALWANTLFTVSGGRGASAAADWSANKTITLPDGKLCALVGSDSMGGSATNLFSALTPLSGNASTVGSRFGSATHALTSDQNGSHSHTGSTSTDGSHQHTGVTGGAGGHSHTGTTNADGSHQHTYAARLGTSLGGTAPSSVTSATDSTAATDFAGSHTHTFGTDFTGFHNHGFTSDAAGSHSHTVTTATSGSGSAHPNVQPSLLVTYYIKL